MDNENYVKLITFSVTRNSVMSNSYEVNISFWCINEFMCSLIYLYETKILDNEIHVQLVTFSVTSNSVMSNSYEVNVLFWCINEYVCGLIYLYEFKFFNHEFMDN